MKQETLSSRLNRRVAIEEPVDIPDGAGGFTSSWQHVADLWAEITPLRGKEYFNFQQLSSVVAYRFLLRHLAGITPHMRIVYSGRNFNIRAILNPEEKSETLEILCEEEVSL